MGVRVLFGRGAAVPQRMFYGSTPVLRDGKHFPVLYDDPSTWPKQFKEAQILRLLEGKLKLGARAPNYKALEWLHASEHTAELSLILKGCVIPSGTKVGFNNEGLNAETSHKPSVEDEITHFFAVTFAGRHKAGNVFAALAKDQAMLSAMQLHVERLSQSTSEKITTFCGGLPFKPSRAVQRDVRRHVWDREQELEAIKNKKQERTALLCNSGTKRTGKSTLLLHTTVEAVAMLTQMVAEHRQAGTIAEPKQGEQDQHRPLGFYVLFNTEVTNTSIDDEILEAKRLPPFSQRLRCAWRTPFLDSNDVDSSSRYKGICTKAFARRHLHDGICTKAFAQRHLHEGICTKAFARRHLHEGICTKAFARTLS